VKYLLFTRRQLPKPYDEVKAEVAAWNVGAPGATMTAKRRVRCVESAEKMFAALHALAATFPLHLAAVVIGHSPTLPKEVYLIRFARDARAADSSASGNAGAVQDCSRRMLRQLVTDVESQMEGVRRAMKLWLFVHHPAPPAAVAAAAAPRVQPSALDGSSLFHDDTAFAPRPGFRIQLGKGAQVVTMDIGAATRFEPDVQKWAPGIGASAQPPPAPLASIVDGGALAGLGLGGQQNGSPGLDGTRNGPEGTAEEPGVWLMCPQTIAGCT